MKKSSLKKIKKSFKIIIWIIVLLTTIISAYSLTFSEIMYNPQGSDTGREWIELSNPTCDNLEEYKLFENNINHNINIYSDGECEYPIICDDCELFRKEYNTSSIIYESSFTLSNTGEYIGLKLNGTIIDSLNYSDVNGIEGMSITLNYNWENTIPTPGYFILQNNETNTSTNMTINASMNITTNFTVNITINTTINETVNQTINVTLNNTYNITINETINMTTNQTINSTKNMTINATQNQSINSTLNETIVENSPTNICSINLGIRLKEDKLIYYNKESIKFYNTINVSPNQKSEYVIEYWVEDIYGNILKNKLQTSNLNEKTYTPAINDKTTGVIVRNQLINISCNGTTQTNILNDSSEKILIIKNQEYKEKECEKCEKTSSTVSSSQSRDNSELSISISDNIIEIDAYRGDDRKYVINSYVKNDKNRKIADLVKLNLEKYSGVNIELGLELDSCGEFDVFAEGLGFLESQKYYKECEKENINKKISGEINEKNVSNKSITQENNISISEKSLGQKSSINKMNPETNISKFFHEPLITGDIIYKSKNEKTKDYSLIGILVLISGTAIYIIYKAIIRKNH